MHRGIQRFLVILAAMVLLGPSVSAADNPQIPFSARVKVSVEGHGRVISDVRGYLTGELLALGDVELVDESQQLELSVLAGELSCEGDMRTGYVLSILVIEPFDCSLIAWCAEQRHKEALKSMTSDLVSYPRWHWLRACGPASLPDICKMIIADFNSEVLEKRRELFRTVHR